MKAHWQYLCYVLRHKRFVYREGRKLGVGRLQLLVHDFQKFLPAEWFPYVQTFYGCDEKYYRDAARRGFVLRKPWGWGRDAFDRAWLHHQKLGGKHHWQYWLLSEDDGGTRALEMPDRYRREMLADWRGAGLALGKPDTAEWYAANRDRMVLHPDTRAWIEAALGGAA